MAQRHFTRADPQLATGENIAMLQSWMSDVAPAELDLLVARTVLQVSYRIVGLGVFECILREQNQRWPISFIVEDCSIQDRYQAVAREYIRVLSSTSARLTHAWFLVYNFSCI